MAQLSRRASSRLCRLLSRLVRPHLHASRRPRAQSHLRQSKLSLFLPASTCITRWNSFLDVSFYTVLQAARCTLADCTRRERNRAEKSLHGTNLHNSE